MTKDAKNRQACKRIAELTEMINKAKKELEEYKAYIRIETGEETTDFGTWVVTFSERITPTVDAKRLQKERPEIFEEYGKLTESKILKVKAQK